MPVDLIECATAEELLDALSPRGKNFSWVNRPHEFLFRGHADSRFQLIPSALRLGTSGVVSGQRFTVTEEMTHGQQITLEWRLLRDFFIKSDEAGLNLPEDTQMTRLRIGKRPEADDPWPGRELLSIAALAQHHGMPTRLLDWSRSSRVAAYFAAVQAARWKMDPSTAPAGAEKLSVWAFHSFALVLQERFDELNRPPSIRVVLVTAPRSSNQNLHAQKGVFTLVERWGVMGSDPVDRTPLDEMSELTTPRLRLYHFTLPIDQAPRLLRLLAHEGVSAATLFPGYGGVVKASHEEELWDLVVSRYNFSK